MALSGALENCSEKPRPCSKTSHSAQARSLRASGLTEASGKPLQTPLAGLT